MRKPFSLYACRILRKPFSLYVCRILRKPVSLYVCRILIKPVSLYVCRIVSSDKGVITDKGASSMSNKNSYVRQTKIEI